MHLPCLTKELREREAPTLWWSWLRVFANMAFIMYSFRSYFPIFNFYRFIVCLSLDLCWVHKQLRWIKHFFWSLRDFCILFKLTFKLRQERVLDSAQVLVEMDFYSKSSSKVLVCTSYLPCTNSAVLIFVMFLDNCYISYSLRHW